VDGTVVAGLTRRQVGVVRPADGEVDGVAHLLVEEDVVREPVDGAVHPDPQFSQSTGTVVRLQQVPDDIFVLARRELGDDAVLEGEPDVTQATPVQCHRHVE
jgi:hypothetical protein